MMLKNSLDKYIQGGKRHEISDISIKKCLNYKKFGSNTTFSFKTRKFKDVSWK